MRYFIVRDIKLTYSEIFTSFQGEAGFAGMPTIWLRFFGCNLNCNGFGQADPTNEQTYVLPYKDIDATKIKSLEELPVFDKGCDSSYSWAKKFRHLAKTNTIEEVAQKIISIGEDELGLNRDNPKGFWRHPITNQAVQLCFTGGEPMLFKHQEEIMDLIYVLGMYEAYPIQITVETNGTMPLKYFKASEIGTQVYYSVSPKLYTVTGEKNAVKYDVLKQYFNDSAGWLKFVVDGSEKCWNELDQHMQHLCIPDNWDIWVMPVGATKKQQEDDQIAKIAREAMRRGYKVATRNHVYVFGNVIGS